MQAPKKRDASNGSIGDESVNGSMISGMLGAQQSQGYMSGGGVPTDNESARLSNVQPYKYNRGDPALGYGSIQKVNPVPKGPSRSRAKRQPSEAGQSSVNSFTNSALPTISNQSSNNRMAKPKNSYGAMTTLQAGDDSQKIRVRKASPDAINLMLANAQANKQ